LRSLALILLVGVSAIGFTVAAFFLFVAEGALQIGGAGGMAVTSIAALFVYGFGHDRCYWDLICNPQT
jgi:hypothetical protein